MKEQTKAPEKIQLSDEDIANLPHAQFKTLVIRMLAEMVEYDCKVEEKGEKRQLVASCLPPTEDLAHNPGLCPDRESNR